MKEPTDFTLRVVGMVGKIPHGKVATYKQIAELCGKPQGSRGVAWILNSCARKYKLPWFRVLSSKGKVSFAPQSREYSLQKRELQREGVVFATDDLIHMRKYQWKRHPRVPKKARRQPRMFG